MKKCKIYFTKINKAIILKLKIMLKMKIDIVLLTVSNINLLKLL